MIDLTQSHDVLGAYHNIGFNGVRKEFTDPATKYAPVSTLGAIAANFRILSTSLTS